MMLHAFRISQSYGVHVHGQKTVVGCLLAIRVRAAQQQVEEQQMECKENSRYRLVFVVFIRSILATSTLLCSNRGQTEECGVWSPWKPRRAIIDPYR